MQPCRSARSPVVTLSASVALLVALSSPLRAQTAPPDGPQIRVGGLIYGQYGWFLSDTADGNHFDVTRAYININGRFPGGVTARITPAGSLAMTDLETGASLDRRPALP